MPVPLRVDWDIAKQLFMGGLSLSDISAKHGISLPALRKRASRFNWRREALQQSRDVSQRVLAAVQSVQIEDTKALAVASNAWKHRIIKLTDRHIAAVENRDPETLTLSDFETLARITDTTDKIARRSFGLDVAQSQTAHLMVHVQSDLVPSATVKQLPGEVIDVESKPVLSNEVAPRE